MTRRLQEENGETTSLVVLIKSDFRRQAEMFGWKRVPVSESFWFTVDFRVRSRIDQIRSRSLRGLLIALEYPIHKLIKAINRSGIGIGAKFAVSGRPTTLKYAATQSPDAFRRRDCSRQQELVRRLAADPGLPARIEAGLLEAGVAPILEGGDGERSGPSLTGGWGRRQKGFHGRFGLRSYRWQADVPERFPGWGEPHEGTGGRTVRQAAGDGSARVRFDTPRRPWARLHAEIEWSGEGGAPALTLDGQPLPTRVETAVDGNPGQIRLTADRRLWRKGRSAVIDVGVAPTADAAVGVSRIWVGRWPEGSDRHSRLWPVRRTAIRLLRSRLTDD